MLASPVNVHNHSKTNVGKSKPELHAEASYGQTQPPQNQPPLRRDRPEDEIPPAGIRFYPAADLRQQHQKVTCLQLPRSNYPKNIVSPSPHEPKIDYIREVKGCLAQSKDKNLSPSFTITIK